MDLLKRHNAKCVKHYVDHQRAIIKENILLADALVHAFGEGCIKSAGTGRTLSGINSSVDKLINYVACRFVVACDRSWFTFVMSTRWTQRYQ